MSAEHPPYDPLYVKAWTLLSVIVGLLLLGMFFFGDSFLRGGHWVWDLVRWLHSPII